MKLSLCYLLMNLQVMLKARVIHKFRECLMSISRVLVLIPIELSSLLAHVGQSPCIESPIHIRVGFGIITV